MAEGVFEGQTGCEVASSAMVGGVTQGPVECSPKGEEGLRQIEDLTPIKFSIRSRAIAMRHPKKIARKGHARGNITMSKQTSKIEGGKRKEPMGEEGSMDDFDVVKCDVDSGGKKLKLDDNIDGKVTSLTVAEIGENQLRERQ